MDYLIAGLLVVLCVICKAVLNTLNEIREAL